MGRDITSSKFKHFRFNFSEIGEVRFCSIIGHWLTARAFLNADLGRIPTAVIPVFNFCRLIVPGDDLLECADLERKKVETSAPI